MFHTNSFYRQKVDSCYFRCFQKNSSYMLLKLWLNVIGNHSQWITKICINCCTLLWPINGWHLWHHVLTYYDHRHYMNVVTELRDFVWVLSLVSIKKFHFILVQKFWNNMNWIVENPSILFQICSVYWIMISLTVGKHSERNINKI